MICIIYLANIITLANRIHNNKFYILHLFIYAYVYLFNVQVLFIIYVSNIKFIYVFS